MQQMYSCIRAIRAWRRVGITKNGELLVVAPTAAALRMADQSDVFLTASRALLGVVARSLAPALEQVTLQQFRVLVLLSTAASPVRSGALAEAIGVHRTTFSRNADRLVAGGWVRRVDNPDSRREILIELTTKGARLVALVTRRRRVEINRVLQVMTPQQRGLAQRGLAAFAKAAGEPVAGDLVTLGM